jgi:hypothetical protein
MDGDYLYVAAQDKGLRVFEITNPANPVRVAAVAQGFGDARAIVVNGERGFVADKEQGLKIVDLSDPGHPVLLNPELPPAPKVAEDVSFRNGKVYVAEGSAGVAVYSADDISERVLVSVGGSAESLRWVGENLEVATASGLTVLRSDPLGRLSLRSADESPAAALFREGLEEKGSAVGPSTAGFGIRNRSTWPGAESDSSLPEAEEKTPAEASHRPAQPPETSPAKAVKQPAPTSQKR